MSEDYFTVRQIVQKIGTRPLCKLLNISIHAPRKWYETGVPGKHWRKLVKNVDWVTYQILEDATAIAERPRPQKKTKGK